MLGQRRGKSAHALVKTHRQNIAQMCEFAGAQVGQQMICTVQGRPIQVGATLANQLLGSLGPGAAFHHTHMGIIDKALKPYGSVAQSGLSLARLGIQHATHQAQCHGIAGAAGSNTCQYHFSGNASRFA